MTVWLQCFSTRAISWRHCLVAGLQSHCDVTGERRQFSGVSRARRREEQEKTEERTEGRQDAASRKGTVKINIH